MVIDEEIYLEHFGKKGMKWGVRNAKSVGKSIGRGTKKTYKLAKKHPKATASIAAGTVFVVGLLTAKGRNKIPGPDYLDFDGPARDVFGKILDPQPHRIKF